MIKDDVVRFSAGVLQRSRHDKNIAAFRGIVINICGSLVQVQKIDQGAALLYPIVKLFRTIPAANLEIIKLP